jgi:hypothetical protein
VYGQRAHRAYGRGGAAVKARRIELRASPEFVRQIEDLAAEMRCSTSSVIRRLVVAEHQRRLPAAMLAATAASHAAAVPDVEVVVAPSRTPPPSPAAAPTVLVPFAQADAASRMFVELGFPPEDFGVACPTGPTEFEAPGP